MNANDLLYNIGFEYGAWKREKKAKHYYKAKRYLGRLEVYLELFLREYSEEAGGSWLAYILKEVRGF